LEPCNHSGKTGPCTEAIINSGIKNVIIGAEDPNPLVSGSGIKNLISHGVAVQAGVCAELVQEQNKFFFFKNTNKRPYITIKIASSKDGKSHLADGDRTFITSKESRQDVQELRAIHDAILTGGNTVVNDLPKMNARVNFPLNQPKKILLSNKSNLDLSAEFFKDCNYEILNETGIHKIIEKYSKTDITSILVEAGPKLVNSFLDSGLVDKVIIYESQNNLGSNGVNWFKEDNTVEKLGFKLESSYKIETDTKKIYIKC
jgi:diaminohydroxyphosphoribosylaminopyrimidine deaminase/5-amino-6-(5-phosphoribosylamino)uracil reductase